MTDEQDAFVPTTFENCGSVPGPFLHGTKAELQPGDELVAGHGSNFEQGRVSNNVYFTTLESTAAWGAQLAAALAGRTDRGRIYVVEPLGVFEDDPNVTNKKFPGNITRSYRTPHPMRVVSELEQWTPHPEDAVAAMLAGLARLRDEGRAVIED